LLISKEI